LEAELKAITRTFRTTHNDVPAETQYFDKKKLRRMLIKKKK
jgi:hypothetical protein